MKLLLFYSVFFLLVLLKFGNTESTLTHLPSKQRTLDATDSCASCARIIGDTNAAAAKVIADINLASRQICQVNSKTEEQCYLLKNVILKSIKVVFDEFLPENPDKATRVLGCSHIMNICMDETRNQVTVANLSCFSCETAFAKGLKVMDKITKEMNDYLPNIFCNEGNEACKQHFMNIIQFAGSIGQVFGGQLAASVACKSLFNCTSD